MSAASAITIPLGSSSSHPRPVRVREDSSPFLIAESVIKSNAKNVLRIIRYSFEWLRLTFENLKDSMPIGNLIRFTKIGGDTFAFGDFARSIMKIGHNVNSFVTKGIAKTISSFAENTLDLLWNIFKVFKALKNPIFPIFTLASKIFVPLQAVGGVSFALSSANRLFKQVKRSSELIDGINRNPTHDLKICKKNDAIIFARVHETAKNICTLLIGLMLTIGAINGFVAPSVVYLTLGTIILISEITSSILQASYKFKL